MPFTHKNIEESLHKIFGLNLQNITHLVLKKLKTWKFTSENDTKEAILQS